MEGKSGRIYNIKISIHAHIRQNVMQKSETQNDLQIKYQKSRKYNITPNFKILNPLPL
jgi:hypothetical protein